MDDIAGLPRGPVDRWLRSAIGDRFDSKEWRAEPISGGLSNLTYRLRLGDGSSVVLRRPPLGGVLPSAHDMRREWTLLTALYGTGIPVPQPLALCTDDSVLGGTFYVMSDVPGEVFRTSADTGALTGPQRRDLSTVFVGTLTDLHALNPYEVGLADFGRPDHFNERQVRRWGEQWRRSQRQELPDMDRLLALMASRIPATHDVSIVHGDFRLDNMLVAAGTADISVNAVVDWELSTLGDPLADLGLALTYWHDMHDDERALIPIALGVTAHPGFMTTTEIAEQYSRTSGRRLDELNFYQAMGAMKLAVILAGVEARFNDGHMSDQGPLSLREAIRVLVARGLRAITV
ncbi:acyl-CoA dehydrogenase [Rhodococcus rhodochrous KG-21]|uniref:Acyl-CoA dehydrogenase n=1 Tax=Rhodococcus rhodochrous KG-21 TaxID=1441923 RepID=A0A0M9WLT5_RHORH|nr:acyl-CoA dehydrogenase [Rhodococcus rhodochrous KG-21]